MSRPAKAARLWLRKRRVRRNGTVEPAVWLIIDGQRQESTGCAPHETERAETKLLEYYDKKHDPRGGSDPASKFVADALSVYLEEVIEETIPEGPRRREEINRIDRLTEFFGDKVFGEINRKLCQNFVKHRRARMGARRDLEILRAALNHYVAEGYGTVAPKVWLPEKGETRKNYLEVEQAAALLKAAWRMRQNYGQDENERRIGKHLAHFITVALHTGTRRMACCTAALERSPGQPYFDLRRGIFYRRPDNARITRKNKNQTPQTIPAPLLAHLKRWKRLGYKFAVEWADGLPTKKINGAFRHACELAGLGEDVVPHTLRHTCVTWLLWAGKEIHEVADFVGMSPEMVLKVYGHHRRNHQQQTANYRTDARRQRLVAQRLAVARNGNSPRGTALPPSPLSN